MNLLTRVVLWVGGLGFIGFGLAFLVAPLATMALAGIELDGALAATELRAFYGGLEVALGALLIGADLAARRRPGLLLAMASYGGIGIARLLGIVLEGEATPFLWAALTVELGLGLAALVALRGQAGHDGDRRPASG